MKRKLLVGAAALSIALGGSVAAAAPASADTPFDAPYWVLCSNGTYPTFIAWDYGVYRTLEDVPPGTCQPFHWPTDSNGNPYQAYVWGEYPGGWTFLVGVLNDLSCSPYPGSVQTWGDMGPGDYWVTEGCS